MTRDTSASLGSMVIAIRDFVFKHGEVTLQQIEQHIIELINRDEAENRYIQNVSDENQRQRQMEKQNNEADSNSDYIDNDNNDIVSQKFSQDEGLPTLGNIGKKPTGIDIYTTSINAEKKSTPKRRIYEVLSAMICLNLFRKENKKFIWNGWFPRPTINEEYLRMKYGEHWLTEVKNLELDQNKKLANEMIVYHYKNRQHSQLEIYNDSDFYIQEVNDNLSISQENNNINDNNEDYIKQDIDNVKDELNNNTIFKSSQKLPPIVITENQNNKEDDNINKNEVKYNDNNSIDDGTDEGIDNHINLDMESSMKKSINDDDSYEFYVVEEIIDLPGSVPLQQTQSLVSTDTAKYIKYYIEQNNAINNNNKNNNQTVTKLEEPSMSYDKTLNDIQSEKENDLLISQNSLNIYLKDRSPSVVELVALNESTTQLRKLIEKVRFLKNNAKINPEVIYPPPFAWAPGVSAGSIQELLNLDKEYDSALNEKKPEELIKKIEESLQSVTAQLLEANERQYIGFPFVVLASDRAANFDIEIKDKTEELDKSKRKFIENKNGEIIETEESKKSLEKRHKKRLRKYLPDYKITKLDVDFGKITSDKDTNIDSALPDTAKDSEFNKYRIKQKEIEAKDRGLCSYMVDYSSVLDTLSSLGK